MFWKGNVEEDGERKAGGRDRGMEEQADVGFQWGWGFQGSTCVTRKASVIQHHTIPRDKTALACPQVVCVN